MLFDSNWRETRSFRNEVAHCRAMAPIKGYKKLLIDKREVPGTARIPWQLGNVCIDLQPGPTETLHSIVAGRTRLGKSTAVLPLLDLDMGVLIIALDNTRPIRERILQLPNGMEWTNDGRSRGWNMLAGDIRLVTESLTAGWPGSADDTGDYRRTARLRMIQRLLLADQNNEPRSLLMLIEALMQKTQDSSADRACAHWARKLQHMEMALNGSLGHGFDMLTAMQQKRKVLMRLNRYLNYEDAPTLGGMLLVHARRVAQECGEPFILVVEEAGQLGRYEEQIIPLAQAAADRQVPMILITQNVAKLKDEVTNNISIWVSFAHESEAELKKMSHHLRLKNPEQLMVESFPGRGERQGRGWAMLRAPGIDTHIVKIKPAIIVPDVETPAERELLALPEHIVIKPESEIFSELFKTPLTLPGRADNIIEVPFTEPVYEDVWPWWVTAPAAGTRADMERWYGNMRRTNRRVPLWSPNKGLWWDKKGCLEWQGPFSRHKGELILGRPRSSSGRRSVTVYIETALAAGKEVEPTWDHNCDNPACCDPEHGEPQTIAVNNRNKPLRDQALKQAWMKEYGAIPEWWIKRNRPREKAA